MRYYDVLRSWFLLIFYIICDMFRKKAVERGTIVQEFRPVINRLIREVVEEVVGAEVLFSLVAIRSPPRFFRECSRLNASSFEERLRVLIKRHAYLWTFPLETPVSGDFFMFETTEPPPAFVKDDLK